MGTPPHSDACDGLKFPCGNSGSVPMSSSGMEKVTTGPQWSWGKRRNKGWGQDLGDADSGEAELFVL